MKVTPATKLGKDQYIQSKPNGNAPIQFGAAPP